MLCRKKQLRLVLKELTVLVSFNTYSTMVTCSKKKANLHITIG